MLVEEEAGKDARAGQEAVAQQLDRRVMDRLREMCTMVEVGGPNRRDRAVQRT